jgi:phospholipid/cholesterol/gamma-HCH transport system permease protein
MAQVSHLFARAREPLSADTVIDGAGITALDATGVWVLHKLFQRDGSGNSALQILHLQPDFAALLGIDPPLPVTEAAHAVNAPSSALLNQIGRHALHQLDNAADMLGFVGEIAVKFVSCFAHPGLFRGRAVLFNIRSAGLDALPIVGLMTFLLGIVVTYQSADQLSRFGANIFVVDLVGLSMLREFAPLLTAIIVAGRSGSAYAAQIGTMKVTEEIDALTTLGIDPYEMLVLPKMIALLVALPLLTVFADVLGVAGGMVMASVKLGVGYHEFLARFAKAIDVSAYLVGISKALVFALIIVVVGCFQGFRASGGPDSIGRQTTRSVVQGIFLVIVVDALFSIVFSALGL